MKARKKFKSYIPSGSAAETTNEQKKPKFRFYDLMKFLNDVFDTRQTISSLSDDIAKNATYTIPEQHENDIVASSSGFTDISLQTPTIHASSSMLTSTRVRTPTQTSVTPRTSTSNNVLLQSPTLSVTSRILASNSRKSLQTADYDSDVSQRMPAAKKQKSDALQIALIEALKEPPAQATDPLDGFLARLGEGMRRLPYRDRARLEIQFLTLLAEKEDIYAHNDPNTELPTRY
ncbi:hypothetical protein ALC62_02432 [Cyphomyrmex costatus]|uniref:BESS domain-containing protein n=2 Tax=Cyphomyrmex costatus TaxID=456900 RepID=A0A151IN21_9HYME|nr:hypothetical protein ALC62_02432 [Cyphomyrmex costatus]